MGVFSARNIFWAASELHGEFPVMSRRSNLGSNSKSFLGLRPKTTQVILKIASLGQHAHQQDIKKQGEP